MTPLNTGPLAGLTMLDLTHMLSGPYGTMLLTDLGVRTIGRRGSISVLAS